MKDKKDLIKILKSKRSSYVSKTELFKELSKNKIVVFIVNTDDSLDYSMDELLTIAPAMTVEFVMYEVKSLEEGYRIIEILEKYKDDFYAVLYKDRCYFLENT